MKVLSPAASLVVLLASCALVLAGIATGATSSGSTASFPAKSCQATGPAYTIAGQKASAYILGLRGSVTCAFATKWMRTLAPRKIGKLPTTIAGPAGWKCTGFQVAPGWPLRAYQGSCRQGSSSFSWTPAGMSGA